MKIPNVLIRRNVENPENFCEEFQIFFSRISGKVQVNLTTVVPSSPRLLANELRGVGMKRLEEGN